MRHSGSISARTEQVQATGVGRQDCVNVVGGGIEGDTSLIVTPTCEPLLRPATRLGFALDMALAHFGFADLGTNHVGHREPSPAYEDDT